MKRSQSPQSGQTPTRVVLGSRPPLWVISEPGSAPAHGSLLGLPAAQRCLWSARSEGVGSGPWVAQTGQWFCWGRGLQPRGSRVGGLDGPSQLPWPPSMASQLHITLPSSLSLGSTFGAYAVFCLGFP